MGHYGNYKPDFELKTREPFLGRLRRFVSKVAHLIVRTEKKAGRAVSVAVAGIFLLLIGMTCCKPHQIVVEKDKVVYVTKDSIVRRDSTVYVPVERYINIAPIGDTLELETTLAKSEAWYDSSANSLRGRMWNLKAVEQKYIEVERWRTKDSLVYVEKPVPYEVEVVKVKRPWWAWVCLTWAILTVASIAWSVYKRLRL